MKAIKHEMIDRTFIINCLHPFIIETSNIFHENYAKIMVLKPPGKVRCRWIKFFLSVLSYFKFKISFQLNHTKASNKQTIYISHCNLYISQRKNILMAITHVSRYHLRRGRLWRPYSKLDPERRTQTDPCDTHSIALPDPI